MEESSARFVLSRISLYHKNIISRFDAFSTDAYITEITLTS